MWRRSALHRCAFCDRPSPNAGLVQGRGRRAYICEECARNAVQVFDDKGTPPRDFGPGIHVVEPEIRATPRRG
jgi:hypothetical protein